MTLDELKAKLPPAAHALADQYGIDLVAYEGGQHLINGDVAAALYNNQMYDFYTAYYDSMSNYFDLFVNYAHAGYGWGVKEWIGEPVTELGAVRYKAIVDWIDANNASPARPAAVRAHAAPVSKVQTAEEFDLRGCRIGSPARRCTGLVVGRDGTVRLPSIMSK